MDKIVLHNLRFVARHGVTERERREKQVFELDLELACDLKSAGRSDCLADSIDYCRLYRLAKAIITERSFALLEGLGECLCVGILQQFSKIESVVLRLRKPEAPLEGIAEEMSPLMGGEPGLFGAGGSVGIELRRSRSQYPPQGANPNKTDTE